MMNSPDELPAYVKMALQAAYGEAVEAYEHGEVPVGAAIVQNRVVIASDRNRIVERRDPTAHAELLVIQKAAEIIQNERLIHCELFTTLEPCAMCSGAIIMARIPAVYFLAADDKLPGLRSVLALQGHNHIPAVIRPRYPDIGAGELLKKFFREKRLQKTSSKEAEI